MNSDRFVSISFSAPWILAAALASGAGAIAGGCTDDAPGGSCPAGVEGCPCRPDGTCKNDLTCVSDTCVVPPNPSCGDGLLDSGEECDNGALNGEQAACKTDCTIAYCGDGVVGPGELCDDGNTSNTDECNENCTVATCGNGVVEAAEACDDGNTTNDDACTNRCLPAACGDGILHDGEACDDGNTAPGDGCSADCVIEVLCGDGTSVEGELCWKAPFPLLTGQAPVGVEVADFNVDGHLDIATASRDEGSFRLFLGNSDGTFIGVPAQDSGVTSPEGLAAGDFDGDGLADLAIVGRTAPQVVVFWGSGSSTGVLALGSPTPFTAGVLDGAHQAVAAEFDTTLTKDELLVATTAGAGLLVFSGPSGRSTPVISGATSGSGGETTVMDIDLNGNGFHQAVVAVPTDGTLQLIDYVVSPKTLDTDGVPAPFAATPIGAPRGLLVADFDADGSEDLVVGNWDAVACDFASNPNACGSQDIGIRFGDGNTGFATDSTMTAGRAPTAFATADMNGDDVLDLVVVNRFSHSLDVRAGNGDGTFGAPLEIDTVGHEPIDIAVADLNGDELPDLIALDTYTNTVGLHLSNP